LLCSATIMSQKRIEKLVHLLIEVLFDVMTYQRDLAGKLSYNQDIASAGNIPSLTLRVKHKNEPLTYCTNSLLNIYIL